MVINAAGMAFVLALSHALLRQGALLQQAPLQFPRVAYTLAAMLIYVGIFFYYGQLLQRFALSRVYPLYSALSIAFVYAAGAIIFREPMSLRGLLGTSFIVIGVIVVASENQP